MTVVGRYCNGVSGVRSHSITVGVALTVYFVVLSYFRFATQQRPTTLRRRDRSETSTIVRRRTGHTKNRLTAVVT